MKVIRVETSRRYDVLIGEGLIGRSGELIRKTAGGEKALIVTDEVVEALYGDIVVESLRESGYHAKKYTIKEGEQSKNAENYIKLLNYMAEVGITRADVVVALGGGVPGDIGGFAAATYMRGVRLVQMPTTLLAAVDSSVGGKTAIDLAAGKNLAGAFYQPEIVICDLGVLRTLPRETFSAGMAEVIKYGVIADVELFDKIADGIEENLEVIIARCVEIKRDIVVEDERETGVRKLLNFGHTIGHAIEKCSDYMVTHGEAVAIGMAVMTLSAARSGMCSMECYDQLVRVLDRYRLPNKTEYTVKSLYQAALSDKKRTGGGITLIIPERIGKCITREIGVAEFEELIEKGMKR